MERAKLEGDWRMEAYQSEHISRRVAEVEEVKPPIVLSPVVPL